MTTIERNQLKISSLDRLFDSRRGRIIRENLTAYVFLFPAMFLIFLFGIFPVGFAFFVSLHEWRRFPEEYVGLENYVDALGNFAYIVFFWLGAAMLIYAGLALYRLFRQSQDAPASRWYLIPGIINALAIAAFVRWFGVLLPVIFDTPNRVRTLERSTGLFVGEFFRSFSFPEVAAADDLMLLALGVALVASVGFFRLVKVKERDVYLFRSLIPPLFAIAGIWMLRLTITQIQAAVDAARLEEADLPVWSQVILVSLGAVLLISAYALWQRASRQDRDRRFIFLALAALLLAGSGYLLIAQLPDALAEADRDVRQGFSTVTMYSFASVFLQMIFGLALASMLFQKLKGKSFFRVVYFLPYVTPFVASSATFTLIFSQRTTAPVNRIFSFLGIAEQKWLLEPTGVFQLIFGEGVPDWLAGPSLALAVIILFNVWTFTGYSTVIFLAGLGNIPSELYEVAKIDGASSWQRFRHVTLPLLSPTTFFLSLIAIIGTFQAFTQIWLMRTRAAERTVDTINIYIFQEIKAARPNFALGSAMAFVLFGVILALTLLQNRTAGRRVFYG